MSHVTIVADIDKVEQFSPIYIAYDYCEEGEKPIHQVTFDVEEEEVTHIRQMMNEYQVDLTILKEILWYYNLMKNDFSGVHWLNTFESDHVLDGFNMDDFDEIKADGEVYFELRKMIRGHWFYEGFGQQEVKGKIVKIVFESIGNGSVQIKSQRFIQAILRGIVHSSRMNFFTHKIDPYLSSLKSHLESKTLDRKESLKNRDKLAYYLFAFLKEHTTISDNQKYRFGAELMYKVGVKFPSNPKSFTDNPKLFEKNFKYWVKRYEKIDCQW